MVEASEFFKNLDDYWLALGKFIHGFAEVERQMQILLWQESKVGSVVAPAIFSGVRMDAAKSMFMRIRAANGMCEDTGLSRVFSQLSLINNARNDVVHYGATYSSAGFTVSNDIAAHIPEKLRTISVSPENLEKMSADLKTILAAIIFYMVETSIPLEQGQPSGHLGLQNASELPWQYIPFQRSQSQKQRPMQNREQSPPPGAFQE